MSEMGDVPVQAPPAEDSSPAIEAPGEQDPGLDVGEGSFEGDTFDDPVDTPDQAEFPGAHDPIPDTPTTAASKGGENFFDRTIKPDFDQAAQRPPAETGTPPDGATRKGTEHPAGPALEPDQATWDAVLGQTPKGPKPS